MTDPNSRIFENATGPVAIRMTNDYLFKATLQKNPRVLKSLISSLLHMNPRRIKNVEVLNPIVLGESAGDKDVVLDVNVSFNNGTLLDLEMQVVNFRDWPERSLYYACRNYTSLAKGETYENASSSIQIGFLDYTLFPEHPSFYSTYRLMDTVNHHLYTEKLSIGVVDLTRIDLANAEDKQYTVDRWAMLFKAQTWEEINMLARQDLHIQEAAATIYQLSEDERIRQQCEAREDYYRRQRGIEQRFRRVNNELHQLSGANSKLTKQNSKLTKQNTRLSDQVSQLSDQKSQLSDQVSQLSDQNSQLSDQVSQLSDQNSQLSDQVSQQAALIAELEARLASKG